MTVEFHVGDYHPIWRREEYTLRHLRDVFAGASACGLMLHHKERNSWAAMGTLASNIPGAPPREADMSLESIYAESHRRIHVRS